MGWPSGAASPSSCLTGFGYSYRLPLVAPATNADLTGRLASRNATLPVSIVPSRVTFAVKSPLLTLPAGSEDASTSNSTVPGVNGPHDDAPSTTFGVTTLARTGSASTRTATKARANDRDRITWLPPDGLSAGASAAIGDRPGPAGPRRVAGRCRGATVHATGVRAAIYTPVTAGSSPADA